MQLQELRGFNHKEHISSIVQKAQIKIIERLDLSSSELTPEDHFRKISQGMISAMEENIQNFNETNRFRN